MNRLQKVLLGLAALLFGGLMLFAGQRIMDRGRFTSAYSTHGAGPVGTRALFELTEQLGRKPVRWARELSGLPAGAVLVVAGGCDSSLAREVARPEADALRQWVVDGGHLIAAGVANYVPGSLGLHYATAATCHSGEDRLGSAPPLPSDVSVRTPWEVRVHAEPGPLAHMLPFTLYGARGISTDGDDIQVLLQSDAGAMAATRRVGHGSVTLVGTGSMWQNRALGQHGAALFERLLRATGSSGPVLFDEYHMGLGERRSLMRYVRDVNATGAAFQLLLVAVLWLISRGTRLGEPRPERWQPPGGSASYVTAMGALYARSRDAQGALQVIAQRALSRIASHYHLRSVPLSQLEQALQAQGYGLAAQYAQRIQGIAAQPTENGAQLVQRSAEIDADLHAALVLRESA